MKRYNLLTTLLLTFAIVAPLSACSDDGGDTETNASMSGDGDGDGDATTETGSGMEIDCATFCVYYVEQSGCIGGGGEFETDAQCQEACGMWDQAGIDCRYEAMLGGSCEDAGSMSSAC